MYNNPYMMNMVRPGLFSRATAAFKGMNFGGLLDGAGKTLGVINQAIPIVYQVKPIINNARTMFKIADELRSPTQVSNNVNSTKPNPDNQEKNTNRPIFYI